MEGPPSPKRARVWPHVDGNHAVLVSFRVPATPALAAAATEALAQLEAFAPTDVRAVALPLDQLHVSVSQSFPVTRAQAAIFARRVLASLQQDTDMAPLTVAFEPTPLLLRNESRTTTFVALRVATRSADALLPYVSAVDAVCTRMGLPCFHDPPVLHISVGWLPGDHSAALAPLLGDAVCVRLRVLHVVVGDQVHAFELDDLIE